MRYALRALGSFALVDIGEEEYTQLLEAKTSLVTMIGVEQKFDLVLENYADYERELLQLSLHEMLNWGKAWQAFQNDIATVSRRLANLLSAARLYLDQIKHDMRVVFGATSDVPDRIGVKAAEQYDARLGYRVMETLRNVMQHRAMPVHRLDYPRDHAGQGLRYRAIPSIEVASLKEADLKPSVLRELEALGEYVVLTPLVREYMEGLGAVHETLRSLTAPHVTSWDSVLASMQRRGVEAGEGDEKRAVLALRLDDDGRLLDRIDVFTDITEYRKAFELRNSLFAHLARKYVSGECSQDDG